MSKHFIEQAVLAVTIVALPASILAQDAVSGPDRSNSQAFYDDYYADAKTRQSEHMQKLAEIDRQYEEATRAYREENARRAQALATENSAAHMALRGKGLVGNERQTEYRRIQAEDKQRRAEYVEWRDSTSSSIQNEYTMARKEELARHKSQMDQLLASRNANLARLRATDTATGLGPATSPALDGATTSSDDEAAQADGYLERGDGSQVSEVAPDGSVGGATGGDGSTLTRDNSGEAGISQEDGSSATASTDTDGVRTSAGTSPGYGASDVERPVRDDSGEFFVYGDGSRVRADMHDGSPGEVNEKGDIVYGDGTTIVHTGDREITIHRPDGSSRTKQVNDSGAWETTDNRSASDYPTGSDVDMPAHDRDGKYYEYGDGVRVMSIGRDGDLGKLNDKGDIQYLDGTTIVHSGDREITIHRPDGSSMTRRLDENGQWENVSATKPSVEGKGSNEKYVSYGSGGGQGKDTASGSADGSGSSSEESGSSGDSDDDTGDKDTKDSSSGNDSDESGSADGDSGDSDSSDSGEDADTEGKDSKEYFGEGGNGRSTGPSDVVHGIVDRATGQSREVETGVPQPCGESGGFGVAQPGPGGSGNCLPGHLPTVSEQDDQQPDTPDAGASADAEDARRAGANDVAGRITQPGLAEEGIPVEDLPSQSALDRSPVVNPSPQ